MSKRAAEVRRNTDKRKTLSDASKKIDKKRLLTDFSFSDLMIASFHFLLYFIIRCEHHDHET